MSHEKAYMWYAGCMTAMMSLGCITSTHIIGHYKEFSAGLMLFINLMTFSLFLVEFTFIVKRAGIERERVETHAI